MNLLEAIKRKLSQTVGSAVTAVKNLFQPKLISPIPPAPKQPTYTPPSFTYASPKAQQASIITSKPTIKVQKPTLVQAVQRLPQVPRAAWEGVIKPSLPTLKRITVEPLKGLVTSAIKLSPPYQLYRQITGKPKMTSQETLSEVGKTVKGIGALTVGVPTQIAGGLFSTVLTPITKERPEEAFGKGVEFMQQLGPLGKTVETLPFVQRLATTVGKTIPQLPLISKVITRTPALQPILERAGAGVTKEALIGAGYGALTGQPPLETAAGFAPFGITRAFGKPPTLQREAVTRGERLFSNIEAKIIANLKKKLEKGTLSMEDTNIVFRFRDKFLTYLPANVRAKLSTAQTIEHLIANLTREQDIAYRQIPEGMRLVGEETRLPPTPAEAIKPAPEKSVDELMGKLRFPTQEGTFDIGGKRIEPIGGKQRGFLETVQKAETTTPALKQAAQEVIPQTYPPIPNKKTLQQAYEIVGQDPDMAKQRFLSKESPSAEKAGIGIALAKKYEAEKNIDNAIEIVESWDNQARAAGQFNQIGALWGKLSPETVLRAAKKAAAKFKIKLGKDVKKNILTSMRRINKMPEGETKRLETLNVLNYVAEKLPLTWREKFTAYRYQNMLSSFKTQLKNISGNLFQTFITRPLDLASEATFDFIRHPFNPMAREVSFSDIPRYYKNVFVAVPNALSAAKEAFKQGYSPTKLDLGRSGESVIETLRRSRMPYKWSFVTRGMEAQDRLFSTLIATGENARLLSKGISIDKAKTMANKLAEQYLYREKLGTIDKSAPLFARALDSVGQFMLKGRNFPVIGKPFEWFVPFVTTPVNIVKFGVERSPLGFIGGSYSKQQMARATLGSLVTFYGGLMALQGRTIWEAPTDEKAKRAFHAQRKKEYSLQIGDKYIPFWYFGPFALSLAIPAAIKHNQDQTKDALTDEQYKKLIKTVSDLSRFVFRQTPMQGTAGFFRMLDGDIDITAESLAGFTMGQAIPFQGFIRWINQIIDPVYRKGRGFKESLMKDIPGLSKQLEPYTSPTGEISTRDFWNAFLPYDIGKRKPEFEPFEKTRLLEMQRNRLENVLEKAFEEGKPLPPSATFENKAELLHSQMKEYDSLMKYKKYEEAKALMQKLEKSGIFTKELAREVLEYRKMDKAGLTKSDRDLLRYDKGTPRAIKIKERLGDFKDPKKADKHLLSLIKSEVIDQTTARELLRLMGKTTGKTGAALPVAPPKLFSATATEIGPKRTPILPSTTLGAITGGVGTFSQGFGARPQVYSRYGLRGHEGYDYVMPTGTPIRNPFTNAVIEKVGQDPSGYGLYVGLRDKNTGEYLLLGHFSRVNVKEGNEIMFNKQIGVSGSSGHSEAPHLHISYTPQYSYRLTRAGGYGGFVNPSEFLKRKIKTS